jgi:hypothetical protein
MGATLQNTSLVNYYFGFLKNLKHDSKLDLISKLSESLKTNQTSENISLLSLFGAYKSNDSAEEIIEQLRASRTFNRNTESL